MNRDKKNLNLGAIVLFLLVVFDFLIWREIFLVNLNDKPEIYFLDVGQGDAELLVLPPKIKILTDAGYGKKIISALDKIKILSDKYIDVAIITHPQQDHFGGFLELLEHYDFGAFVINGRNNPEVSSWKTLIDKIEEKKIPLITLERRDKIRYQENKIKILSPDKNLIESAELNDTGIVQFIETQFFRALFAADIGKNVEKYLIKNNDVLRADILKVAHHGSKYSSGINFLEIVQPKLAVVEVGEGNRYGHPTREVLEQLKLKGSQIFRTDLNGTVKVSVSQNKKLQVFVDKINFQNSP